MNVLTDETVSPAAERMRASRQRRRDGLRCMTIEIRDSEITELVNRGNLQAGREREISAIRDAIYALFESMLVPAGCAQPKLVTGAKTGALRATLGGGRHGKFSA